MNIACTYQGGSANESIDWYEKLKRLNYITEDTFIDGGQTLFCALVDKYLEDVKDSISPTTWEDYRTVLSVVCNQYPTLKVKNLNLQIIR